MTFNKSTKTSNFSQGAAKANRNGRTSHHPTGATRQPIREGRRDRQQTRTPARAHFGSSKSSGPPGGKVQTNNGTVPLNTAAGQHGNASEPVLGGTRQPGTARNTVRNMWSSQFQPASRLNAATSILGGTRPSGPVIDAVRSSWASRPTTSSSTSLN